MKGEIGLFLYIVPLTISLALGTSLIEVTVSLNYERLARYGLTVEDIARNIRIAYDGQVVTSTRYGEEDVDFRIMLAKTYRQRLDYLRQLRIPNRQGELIGLEEVASLDVAPGPSALFHYEGERMVIITATVQPDVTTPMNVLKAGTTSSWLRWR